VQLRERSCDSQVRTELNGANYRVLAWRSKGKSWENFSDRAKTAFDRGPVALSVRRFEEHPTIATIT